MIFMLWQSKESRVKGMSLHKRWSMKLVNSSQEMSNFSLQLKYKIMLESMHELIFENF